MLDIASDVFYDHDFVTKPITPIHARRGGAFFQASNNLHVYCRPDCPSLDPHYSHLRAFGTQDAASDAGLLPCGWCRPDRPSTAHDVRRVARACRTVIDVCRALIFLP